MTGSKVCAFCHGFEHPTVSVHSPLCETLNGSSRTFDRVPVEVLEGWRVAGVPMHRCWLTSEGKAHWRGTFALDAIWHALLMHSMAAKHLLPHSLFTLVEKVLTDESARIALETLWFGCDQTGRHSEMYQNVEQIMEGIGVNTKYLADAMEWRRRTR